MAIIILSADSASAWIVSSTDASVAAATTPTTTGILKHDDDPHEENDHHLGNIISHRMYNQNTPSAPSPSLRLPFLFQDLDFKFPPIRNIFVPSPPPQQEEPSPRKSSSWSHSIQDDSIPCTYHPVWEWQTEYFQQHLTNFREVPLLDPSLADVTDEKARTRVRTKWYSSNEYRLIRMTYMDGGAMSQSFTTVCYPRSLTMPIMGHGLLQIGDRRITISDFQPLLQNDDDSQHAELAKKYLKPIQEEYPSLQEKMSERFFEQGSDTYWSDYTLLGRFSASDDKDGTMWKDLWPAYQACVQTHVQLIQEQQQAVSNVQDDDDCIHNTRRLLEEHASYDAHVSSGDPAMKILTRIFGEEMATKIVYETLFPLADPPMSSSSREQPQ